MVYKIRICSIIKYSSLHSLCSHIYSYKRISVGQFFISKFSMAFHKSSWYSYNGSIKTSGKIALSDIGARRKPEVSNLRQSYFPFYKIQRPQKNILLKTSICNIFEDTSRYRLFHFCITRKLEIVHSIKSFLYVKVPYWSVCIRGRMFPNPYILKREPWR